MMCPEPEVRIRLWTAPLGTPVGTGTWTAGQSFCAAPTEPATPVLSVEEFRRLPLPAGTSVVQPPGTDVLIRMPANAYTTSTRPVLLNTTLLGQAVQVRATPTSWTFDYGDGTKVGPSKDPGGPYPKLTTAHTYTTAGSYTITLTTHYSGEYSVAGGPWLPVDGQAHVTSPGHLVVVRTAESQLVTE